MVERRLECWNGRAIMQTPVQLTIETDAPTKGWGAHCQGVSTGGRWSPLEKEQHINCFELLALSLAVKTFAIGVAKAHILLFLDIVSPVAYINKLGGAIMARDLWTWSLANQIYLTTQHIPGVTNYHADRESRVFQDSSHWNLNPQLFLVLNELWGPLDIEFLPLD